MRKFIFLISIILVVVNSFVITSFASTHISVTVDGNKVNFPDAKPFIDKNNRTLIPVRFVSEALGSTVKWNDELREVDITKNDIAIKVRINDRNLVINKKIQPMDTKAIIKEDRTFVPIRYVAEALGAEVKWNETTRTVIIKTVSETEPTPTPVNTAIPTVTEQYDPSKWVSINENGEDYELSINIDWNISEKFKANCDFAESIISKKYNSDIAKQVVDIARSKTERRDMFRKTLQNDGKQIDIISSGTSISILFWKEGVNP